MVIFFQLCSHPLKVCLNCETRPCHTLVCIGQGVWSECREDSGIVHSGLRLEQLLREHPPPYLDHSHVHQRGCNIQRDRGNVPKSLSSHSH